MITRDRLGRFTAKGSGSAKARSKTASLLKSLRKVGDKRGAATVKTMHQQFGHLPPNKSAVRKLYDKTGY